MSMTARDVSQCSQPPDLGDTAGRVEACLGEFVDQRPLPANLADAIRYSLLGSGKRLRPILAVRTCEAVGGKIKQALPAAAAIEMIHCFSLVHDDLPAMDDDDLRRGKPTLHRHTSEAMAILAGDALMGLAFELVAQRVRPEVIAGRIIRELSTATNDMIAGQVYDTIPDFDASMEPIERLRTIHHHKTGALIRCACRMGAISGGCDQWQLQAVTRYAQAIGLMFQIVDDVLDVTQTTQQLGKAAHKDAQKGKLTYPGMIGLDASRSQIEQLRSQALDALQSLDTPAQPLRDLCEYMAVRTK